jgi:hypothetical protein
MPNQVEKFTELTDRQAYDKFESLCASRAKIDGLFISWKDVPEAVVREVRLEYPTLAIEARHYVQANYPEMARRDPIWQF